jgi:hypothetical protein
MAGLNWFATLRSAAVEHLRASDQGARGDGRPLSYVFETPHGRILYQDTSGYWTGPKRLILAHHDDWLPN